MSTRMYQKQFKVTPDEAERINRAILYAANRFNISFSIKNVPAGRFTEKQIVTITIEGKQAEAKKAEEEFMFQLNGSDFAKLARWYLNNDGV